ncbi:hypothetical protein GOP47_0002145 [Adiantum capillus-veneris]|uniref:ATP-dependent RNA helicase n=1 Tax=Adiantum capillus-veneris TaxID=13818 RepID=A0A9D4ZQY5_ADICA|nr:hypothetical protein GOP47_0025467 [Adiantum capillus-veneris]KAI5082402.1 hypothetical protein GOP47_0002145 [Adiantum capillus-veneris]
MSRQVLSRHGHLRRALVPPASFFRACASSSSSFYHGSHAELPRSFSSLSDGVELLHIPSKWFAAVTSKLQVGSVPPASAKPEQKPNQSGKSQPLSVSSRKRDSNSRARDGATFMFSNAFLRTSLHSNWTSSKLSRAIHSAIGDDDSDESDELDDFLLDPEIPHRKERSSSSRGEKGSPALHKISDSEEDDDEVPMITTNKRRTSAIDACEDSDDVEEEKGRASAKKKRSGNDRNVADSRATFSKKRPVALENLPEEKASYSRRASESHLVPDGAEEEDTEVRQVNKSTDHNSSSEEGSSGPSYLTKTRFDKFPVSPLSIKALHSVLKYEKMTEVQEATFPVILKGQDVLAKARTGTGKTIAFLLPAIEAILKAPEGRARNPVYVLIVCPTRELAQQAAAEAKVLLQFHRGLGAQVVYGGCSIRGEQMNLSKSPCQILVGTPGRLVDHIQRTPEMDRQLKSVQLFVLDEADHMLDMGFRDSLQKIMQAIPSKRQTLLFSATIPREVHSMAKVALRNDHVFIDAVGKDSEDTHAKVKQQYIVAPLEKQIRVLYAALKQHMEADPHYKVLVFCSTARTTGFMCKLFMNLGFNSKEIHSRKDQSYRTRVSDEFRQSKGGIILFTSDVSARGVDYPNVTLVVQVGAPSEMEQYIHRLGRTGRAGKKGEGLLILAPWESYFLEKLAKLPLTQLPPPKLTAQAKTKILNAASLVDAPLKEMAYTSWLGYYRSLKGLSLDKAMLVEYANQFSASMGFDEPPALSRMVASKMALNGVPGIRLRR